MSEFNENSINRDASGKFAPKTSGEPEGVDMGSPSIYASDEIDLGYDDIERAYVTTDEDGSRITAVVRARFDSVDPDVVDEHPQIATHVVEDRFGAHAVTTWDEPSEGVEFEMTCEPIDTDDDEELISHFINTTKLNDFRAAVNGGPSESLDRSVRRAYDRWGLDVYHEINNDVAEPALYSRELCDDVRARGTAVDDDVTWMRNPTNAPLRDGRVIHPENSIVAVKNSTDRAYIIDATDEASRDRQLRNLRFGLNLNDSDDAELTAKRFCSPRRDHGFAGLSDMDSIRQARDDAERQADNEYESGLIDDDQYTTALRTIRTQADARRAEIEADPAGAADVPKGYDIGSPTPFGTVIDRREISAGLALVTTDRSGDGSQLHGGYVLSERRDEAMGALRRPNRFYETDADAALVAMRYPHDMNVRSDKRLREVEAEAESYYPRQYARYREQNEGL